MSKVLRSLRKSFIGKPLDEAELAALAAAENTSNASCGSPSTETQPPSESISSEPKATSKAPTGDGEKTKKEALADLSSDVPTPSSPSKSKSSKPKKSSSSKSSRHGRSASSPSNKKSSSSRKKSSRSSSHKRNESSKSEKIERRERLLDDEPLDDDVHQFDPAESSEDTDNFVGDYDFTDEHSGEEHRHPSDFSCLSPDEIIAAQKKAISEVSELLMISASNASNLIRHYQWKTERLLQAYFDNPEKVIKEAGIVGATGHTANEEGSRSVLTDVGECLICCEDVSPSESCALTCGHRFCKSCWDSYLSLKIKEGEVLRINCPAVSCHLTVPDDVIKEMVPQDSYEKYLRFVTKSFVEDNDHVTWCPAPGCGNAITADQLHGLVVQCTCGYSFCFSCQEEDHRPASCDQLQMWKRKCSDESETSHWLGANTKDCPKCRVAVEKNGGCMHMTCRQCGYEWCWLCTKIWKGHDDFYSCSRYEKASKKSADKKGKKSKKAKLQALEEEREQKRKALERYLNYYQKYLEYEAAAKKAPELLERAHQKMESLQSEQSTLAEVKFIEKAARVLSSCHVVLRNSYIYSYYLEDDSSTQKQLFLFLQGELEKTASTLATSLEAANILKRRTEVVDMTVLAQTKRENLIRSVDE